MRKILVLLLLITLQFSTTITGEIFNGDSFEKINNTLVTLEDSEGNTLFQSVFNEEYQIDFDSGNYVLRAYHYSNGKVDFYESYNIQLNKDMELDLVLLPYELQELVPGFDPPPLVNQTDTGGIWNGGKIEVDYLTILVLLIVFLGGVFVYKYLSEEKKSTKKIEHSGPVKEEREEKTKIELDEDCKKVLKILKENEGRMMQKEIREIMNLSETKMSLIIAELEACKLIKRIKKGRENILKIIEKKI